MRPPSRIPRPPRRDLLSLVVALLLGMPGPAAAQSPRRISAAELLARVGEADPRLEVLAARVEEARAELEGARALPNPSITYNREEVFAREQSLPEDYLSLAVPIELAGRRRLRIEAAAAGVRATEAEAERARLVLELDALDLFHEAAALQARVEVLRERRDAMTRLLEAVRARTAAGDASGYDLVRVELELGGHEDLLVDAERELAAARRSLALLAGEPAGAELEAAGGLELPPAPPPAVVLAGAALEGRGDYRASRLRAASAEHELAAARRAWVPTLQLSGGLKSSSSGTDTAWGYTAGLTLALPILDRGQSDRARAAAARRLALADARVVERTIRLELQRARDALALRVAQVTRYEQANLLRLGALVRQAEVSYREGERPVFELLDAYRTARDVRLRHLELRREAKRSELALWRALGRRP